ncbi:MAG: hypothetical protein L0332_14990 [Chloroflexi bacterium]|nr:hypothetical protein [Chloroflexota bacterium]MCI0577081.1 hypothetical protein [Chloroflexota bacterium]MCI0650153.1 hypothetical protein [Chloroflexota bacterium]MCI0728008.1 hypothetical protein [Chloroflexota bacterium]
MEHCVNHPDHAAVEHCEVCGRALCGLCLWYGEDGRRLCEIHAQELRAAGEEVLPPETYAEAIEPRLLKQPAAGNAASVPYQGNSQDVTAFLAAVISLTTLFSCMGGVYCLPIVAAALGLAAFANASKAVDPQRTRTLAGVSLGIGGLMLLFILAYVGFFVGVMAFSFALATSSAPPPRPLVP